MMEARITPETAMPVEEPLTQTPPMEALEAAALPDSAAPAVQTGPHLVTGLTWEVAHTPETPVTRTDAPAVLRLPSRRAVLPEGATSDTGPATALLLAMAAELPQEAAGPWAFLAGAPGGPGASAGGHAQSDGEQRCWLALADLVAGTAGAPSDIASRVIPRPGPEQMFETPEEALLALQDHLETTDLAGLAVLASPQDDVLRAPLAGLSRIAPALPRVDIDPMVISRAAVPCFTPPRQVPVRLLGGAGACVALLLVGLFGAVPLLRAAFTPPPPPPVEMVEVIPEPGAFAAACTRALEGWWPRVVGWQSARTGCALPRHLPETLDLPLAAAAPADASAPSGPPTVPLVIWQDLRPAPARNRILAEAAATDVIATWAYEARLESGRLTLWKTVLLPLVSYAPDATTAPGAQAARGAGQTPDAQARLTAVWADRPGAVREMEGQVTIATGRMTPAALFERAARVPELAPLRLLRGAEGGLLSLAPPQPRPIPADLMIPANLM
ncbi:MAG: hypothetical protein OXE48_06565, partial [Gammaproteobacteria bacterium]|nr:hypothetical protein [Gammaproteobacteria bacterium]